MSEYTCSGNARYSRPAGALCQVFRARQFVGGVGVWGRAVPALIPRIENHGSLNGAQIVINGVDGWQCQIDVYRGKILNRHISIAILREL